MVFNVLISLYMACGLVTEAELVFREILDPDEVSWNSLISGLYRNDLFQTTIDVFGKMREVGVRVTSFMLSSVVAACAEVQTDGRRIHGLAIKTGMVTDCFPGSALIRMYSKTNNMEEASNVFQELGFKDIASWNSLIQGYGESDQGEKGLEIFNSLMKCGVKTDEITITGVMGICSGLVMVDSGNQMHSLSVKTGLDTRIPVQNSLIDMYAKCGNLEDGLNIFRQMKDKSVVSWTSMMGGLTYHGRTHEALQLFAEMKREGLNPNKFTYACILLACSHSGLIDIGRSLYNSVEVEAEEEHYICMVRLFAGGHRFAELEEFIARAPEQHQESLWESYLVACKNLGEWERAVKIAEKMVRAGSAIKPHIHVLLSSVFAGAGRKWKR